MKWGNKTFFFFNYEGYRHSQADSMTETVPTLEEIAGNFQNSGVTIYDPYNVTTPGQPASATNPRLRFTNNTIPSRTSARRRNFSSKDISLSQMWRRA